MNKVLDFQGTICTNAKILATSVTKRRNQLLDCEGLPNAGVAYASETLASVVYEVT